MATSVLDPQGGLKVVDTGTNATALATGREDLTKADYLEITVNGATRSIQVLGKNDGETPTRVPITIGGLSEEFQAFVASDTLTRDESGKTCVNTGAGGLVALTLPQDAHAGCRFRICLTVAQAFRFLPGAAGAIYINGAKQADNKYITSSTIGDTVKLIADGNGDWVAVETGTFTVES